MQPKYKIKFLCALKLLYKLDLLVIRARLNIFLGTPLTCVCFILLRLRAKSKGGSSVLRKVLFDQVHKCAAEKVVVGESAFGGRSLLLQQIENERLPGTEGFFPSPLMCLFCGSGNLSCWHSSPFSGFPLLYNHQSLLVFHL